jgi:hypothetical protein
LIEWDAVFALDLVDPCLLGELGDKSVVFAAEEDVAFLEIGLGETKPEIKGVRKTTHVADVSIAGLNCTGIGVAGLEVDVSALSTHIMPL